VSDSVWKKEIHLRKPKEKKVEQPVAEQPVAVQSEASTSVWKKEIRLRKPKEPKVEVAQAAAAPAPPAPQPEESFWKRERHVRRQAEPLPPMPRHLLEQQRRPRNTVVVPVMPKARADEYSAFPRPAAQTPQQFVSLLPESRIERHDVPSGPPAGHVEPPATPPVWPSPALDAAPEPEPPLPVWPPAAVEPPAAPSPEPVASPAPAPVLPAPAVESIEELAAAFASSPAVDETPDEPPAPVATPEPAPAQAEHVPFYKREISFSRKPKAPKAPKAVEEPKAVKEPKATKQEKKAAKQEQKAAKPANDVPFYKREISFGRKPKASQQKAPRQKTNDAHKISSVVGLRIGSSQLAAAHVRNNGSAEVVQLAQVPLERGVVVAGEVREPVALAKALKSFFASNKLPRKDIRLGIASNRIGVRVLDVPPVDDPKQFENAIRFRAQESLPISVADAVLDHVVLEEGPNGDGEDMRRVLVVFAHRELVNRYVDVCKQAGLRLAGIDLDAFGLLRAIGPSVGAETEPRATVAVSVGNDRTVFAVSDGTVCDFTRVLEWGSGAVDVAIARALNLTPSEAEPIKRMLDLDASEPPEGLGPMQFEAARAAAKSEVGHLVRELLSSLRFYQSRPGSLDLAEVVLSGGGSQMPGFAAEVQRGLGAPVRLADPFSRVEVASKLSLPVDSGSLAIAVGLGIQA